MSSLFPYAQYYLNYDYIVDVLCINKDKPITICYGKCYLSNQLDKTTGDDESIIPSTQNDWQKQPLTLTSAEQFPLSAAIHVRKCSYGHQLFPLSSRSTKPPTPPPQC